jgi:hypothetical protein
MESEAAQSQGGSVLAPTLLLVLSYLNLNVARTYLNRRVVVLFVCLFVYFVLFESKDQSWFV